MNDIEMLILLLDNDLNMFQRIYAEADGADRDFRYVEGVIEGLRIALAKLNNAKITKDKILADKEPVREKDGVS